MKAANQLTVNWRRRLNRNTEKSLMHIVRAADQLQSLLPTRAPGGDWNWWRVFEDPKLVKKCGDEKIEIEQRARDELPTLNRFGF